MTTPSSPLHPVRDARDHAVAALLEAATDLGHTRAVLIDQLQVRMRSFVDEWGSAADGSTTVEVPAQGTNLEVIRFIFIVLPVGTTSATLTLPSPRGARSIPIQNTSPVIGPVAFLCVNAPRVLTYDPPGAAYLELMGEEIPTGGVL